DQTTAIIFTSDHGDMLGERGLWYKWTLLEGAVRVPLVIALPGQEAVRIMEPVSLLDLLPTCLAIGSDDAHQVPLVSDIEGDSLLPCATGQASLPAERAVFSEMLADGATSPCLMVRRGPWKYIFCESDPPQLFHLGRDPLEQRNLAGSAEV